MLLVGCGNSRVRKELIGIDSLINTAPDSAYTLMSKMDVSSWSRGDRMRYELMRADAQNKAYLPFTSDSTMKEVVEYFDSHGTNNEKVKAYYLLGSVYRDMDSIPKAINAFNKAADVADTMAVDCDWNLLASVHAQASGCFRKVFLFDYAISENEKNLYYCLKSKDIFYYANGTEQLGHVYLAQDSLVKAERLFREARRLFLKFGRKDAAISSGPIIGVLVEQGRYEECDSLFKEYEKYSGFYDKDGNIERGREVVYYYKGMCLMSKGDYANAEVNLRKSLVNTPEDSLVACLGLSKLFKETGKPDSALKYSMFSQNLQEKIDNTLSVNLYTVLKAISEYSQNKQKEAAKKIIFFRTGMIIAISVIILLAVLCVIYVSYHRNRNRTLLMAKNYATDILKLIDLQREYNELSQEYEALIQEKDKISAEHYYTQQEKIRYKEQIAKLSRALFESQLQSENDGKQTNEIIEEEDFEETLFKSMTFSPVVGLLHSYAKKGITADERDWDLFLKTAYKHMPEFLHILQQTNGGLKSKELYICLLIKLRFHLSEICCLMDMKSNTLANARKRLLKKIFNIEGRASEFDMKITTLVPDKSR